MTKPITVHKDEKHPKDALWWRPFFSMQEQMQKVMQGESAQLMTSSFMPPFIWDTEQKLFSKTQQGMQRFFGEAFNSRQMALPWTMGDNTEPYVDIIENGNHFKLVAELPGISSDNVDISLSEDAITIAGEKQENSMEEGDGYIHQECRHGAFSRTIALPDEANVEEASAEFEDGVLTIEIPKKSESKDSKSPVKSTVKPKPTATPKRKATAA